MEEAQKAELAKMRAKQEEEAKIKRAQKEAEAKKA
jgi:hypothetical protein